MDRHELDKTSLVAGVVIVLIAVAVLLDDVVDLGVGARWFGPLLLIGAGAVGLASLLRRPSR